MSEDQSDQMIGRLVREKSAAEKKHAELDRIIQSVGEQFEMLGAKLRSTASGGDPSDLLGFFEKNGIGVDRLREMLQGRSAAAEEIHRLKTELQKLGIS